MINLHLNLSPNSEQLTQTLNATERQLKTALVRALNKTARWMRTRIAKDTAQALKVRVKDVNPGLALLSARASQTIAGIGLKPSAGVIKAEQLGSVRQTAGGTRAGQYYWPHAFIWTTPGGQRGVFRRSSKSRLPIRAVQLIVTSRMAERMQQLSQGPAIQQFDKTFARELRYLITTT